MKSFHIIDRTISKKFLIEKCTNGYLNSYHIVHFELLRLKVISDWRPLFTIYKLIFCINFDRVNIKHQWLITQNLRMKCWKIISYIIAEQKKVSKISSANCNHNRFVIKTYKNNIEKFTFKENSLIEVAYNRFLSSWFLVILFPRGSSSCNN